MTTLSNAEGRAYIEQMKRKGKVKADKPPPIKMPKEAKPETLRHQLDQSEVERALDRLQFRVADGCYMEMHPLHRLIITPDGFRFILKPE